MHHVHHHGAEAPDLATHELAHQDHDGLAPLGASAAPPVGLSPPKRDDGPTVASGGPSEGQGNADSADCADHHQPEQLDEAAAAIKRLATLRARLALSGWVLTTLPSGAHIVTRWGVVRHCTSLDAVESFAQQVGVRS